MRGPVNHYVVPGLLVFFSLQLFLQDFKLLDRIIDFLIKMLEAFALFCRHSFEFIQGFLDDIQHPAILLVLIMAASGRDLGTTIIHIGIHSPQHGPADV